MAVRLVFIDESWTNTDMAPLRGWAPRSSAGCLGSARALEDHDFPRGVTPRPYRCALVYRSPIDRESFCLYVKEVLLPTLRQGDIVILDNLGSPAEGCRSDR
jgi:hypothetical protein